MEDDREFWLASLDDLDEELAAGDLEPADHQALTQSYTRRAADALRQEGGPPAPPGRGPGWKRLAVVAALVAVGALAGVMLGRAVGSRHAGDTITGNDAVTSTAGLLRDAEDSIAAGDRAEALRIYQQVLDRSPSHPVALAYRGWLQALDGQLGEAADSLADAVAADPAYPDARAFRTIVLYRTGDCSAAAAELAAFDATDPPSLMADLVQQQGLRGRIPLCLALEQGAEGPLTLASLGANADDAVAAAVALWEPTAPSEGDPGLALRVYEAVLGDHPDHGLALTYSGVLLIQTGPVEQAAVGAGRINRAVEVAPDDPETWLWRAWLYLGLDRVDQALADLDRLNALNPPPEIALLADDLRSRAAER
ncbi:tetratricopeptide repeat protein [Candidatus Poriferisocius sp.]|uniref:tetratricopeptide repeat protein n=1 Tax=Candidatus Poriferisocius sp. TaxID=3101276 RepID=UPI003B58B859